MKETIILITAYDVNPYKGSESATGWNFIYQASKYYKVLAFTRKNNKSHIESFIRENNLCTTNLKFFYFDLPKWAMFWKRGPRGASLYFYLWQMTIPFYIKRLGLEFDIAHGLNFHASAYPNFLWILGKPVIWGPINHNEPVPKDYFLSFKDYVVDRLKWLNKLFFWYLDPFHMLARRKVSFVLGGSKCVKKRLLLDENKFIYFPQVGSTKPPFMSCERIRAKIAKKTFTVLSVGRLIYIKSFDVVILAFKRFIDSLLSQKQFGSNYQFKLVLVGDGPHKHYLVRLVRNLGLQAYVDFVGWQPKEKVGKFYQEADVFFFPSHEGAGMVVVEALSYGLPVLCFDKCGPGELVDESCSIRVPSVGKGKAIELFAESLLRLYLDKHIRLNLSLSAYRKFLQEYEWNMKGRKLRDIYEMVLK